MKGLKKLYYQLIIYDKRSSRSEHDDLLQIMLDSGDEFTGSIDINHF